ncbi:MAG: DUF4079 family protein [Thermodesulfobacteriota bacterium]
MLQVHPVLMLLTAGLMLYVLKLGLSRLAAKRFGARTVFPWRRHVLLGKIVMAAFAAGFCGGLLMTWIHWSTPLKSGAHALGGLGILALAASGTLSGLALDRKRRSGNPLAVLHGIGNILMAALVALQAWTGYVLLRDFVW